MTFRTPKIPIISPSFALRLSSRRKSSFCTWCSVERGKSAKFASCCFHIYDSLEMFPEIKNIPSKESTFVRVRSSLLFEVFFFTSFSTRVCLVKLFWTSPIAANFLCQSFRFQCSFPSKTSARDTSRALCFEIFNESIFLSSFFFLQWKSLRDEA